MEPRGGKLFFYLAGGGRGKKGSNCALYIQELHRIFKKWRLKYGLKLRTNFFPKKNWPVDFLPPR